jgi:hypothetical protein
MPASHDFACRPSCLNNRDAKFDIERTLAVELGFAFRCAAVPFESLRTQVAQKDPTAARRAQDRPPLAQWFAGLFSERTLFGKLPEPEAQFERSQANTHARATGPKTKRLVDINDLERVESIVLLRNRGENVTLFNSTLSSCRLSVPAGGVVSDSSDHARTARKRSGHCEWSLPPMRVSAYACATSVSARMRIINATEAVLSADA